MKLKNVLTISAIYLAVLGVGFMLAPRELRIDELDSITLVDGSGGTDLLAVDEALAPGLSPGDNETGCRMALVKLAARVEENSRTRSPAAGERAPSGLTQRGIRM